ncbi:MAG TPA: MerR family transcriptional regulator [Candidatus Binataceae bacterium]|nr:MerR family transcriptional regulator [Candidatus Binataceae bacterium]
MQYVLEELVRASRLSVDTVRYYQTRGLLHRPRRRGRRVYYDDSHLNRLRAIRSARASGLPLGLIGKLLAQGGELTSDAVLLLAVGKEAARQRHTGAEVARRLGIAPELVELAERLGLGTTSSDKARGYSDGELETARYALKLVRYGFPIPKLFALAVKHDRYTRRIVEEAVDLFNEHVRKGSTVKGREDVLAVARAFEELLPAVTALVAAHFQRTLINRALAKLKGRTPADTWELAHKTAAQAQLRIRIQ